MTMTTLIFLGILRATRLRVVTRLMILLSTTTTTLRQYVLPSHRRPRRERGLELRLLQINELQNLQTYKEKSWTIS